MELTHDFVVPASVEATWATFMDLERVGGCFPGAVVTSATAEGFAGTVKVKLGPIALQYGGAGQFLERDDVNHRAVIEAKGKDKRGNGTAGATVTIQLAPAQGGTRVDVATDLAITGKPAQFGRGVMQDVSDKLLGQFVACIESQFAAMPADAGMPASPADATAAPAAGAESAGSAEAPAAGSSAEASAAAASAARPAAPRPAHAGPAADDSIDLGATVLPVLIKTYAPYAAAGLVGLIVGWLLGRR